MGKYTGCTKPYYGRNSHCDCEACRVTTRSNYRPVKTTSTSSFDDGKGNYFVMSPNTRRTYTDHGGAVDHATHLIADGNNDEFLIVKVVGRVKKRLPPVDYISVE